MTPTTDTRNNLRAYLATEHYERKKQELQREINKEGILRIDRACFAKTDVEKQKAKEAKSAWKKMKAAEDAALLNEQEG